MSVGEYIRKFDRGSHFVPLIENDAGENLSHFVDGLKPTIRRDVMMMDPAVYATATTRAFMVEQALKDIEIDAQRKRPQQNQTFSQSNKKQFSGSSRFQGHQKPQGQSRQQRLQLKAVQKTEVIPLCKECHRP